MQLPHCLVVVTPVDVVDEYGATWERSHIGMREAITYPERAPLSQVREPGPRAVRSVKSSPPMRPSGYSSILTESTGRVLSGGSFRAVVTGRS